MHKLIFLLILFFPFTIYSDIKVEPLYKEFYRPNFWYPINFVAQDVPQNLETKLDDFTVHLPSKNNMIGYYLVQKNLSQLIVFDDQKKILDKPLVLQPLGEDKILIGIYDKNVILPASKDKIVYTALNFLPDYWEGLGPLNALVIRQSISLQQQKTILRWVHAGGNIFISNANFIPSLKENNFYPFARYGRGKIFVLPEEDLLQQEINKKTHDFSLVDIKNIKQTPPLKNHTWSLELQLKVILFCLIHIILIIATYNKKKMRIFIFVIINCASLLFLLVWLSTYEKVSYVCWELQKFYSDQETSFCQQFHQFTSLTTQNWEYDFSDLPMPTTTKSELLRTSNGWKIKIPEFTKSTSYTIQTFTTRDYIGHIKIINKEESFTLVNESELEWKNMQLINQNKCIPVGDLLIGDEKNIPSNNKDTLFKNLPIKLENENSKEWLQDFFSEDTFFTVDLQQMNTQFAHTEKIYINYLYFLRK